MLGLCPYRSSFDRLPSLVARIGSPMLRGVWARLVLVTAFLPGRLTENSIEFEPNWPDVSAGHTRAREVEFGPRARPCPQCKPSIVAVSLGWDGCSSQGHSSRRQ